MIADVAGNPAADFADEDATNVTGYTLELCDRATDTLLADLTGVATFTIQPRRSGQALAIVAALAADNAAIRDTTFDGTRALTKGIRTLKVRLDGVLIGHVIVWRIDYGGDENSTSLTVTGYDGLYTLRGRPYRDATGNLIDPDIASPIAGATILKDGVANSISNSGPAGDQEGPLPLDATSGTFDETIPPAADLGVELTDWPINLDAIVTLLAQTGAVDIWVDPVDTAMGYDPGIIGVLNVANRRGSDLSDTVQFSFATDGNVKGVRRSDDMDRLDNKKIYYLGPKRDTEHWAGNITATETTPEDLSAYLTLEEASRDKYWTIVDIKVIDDNADDNAARELYHVAWKEDVVSSVEGQEVIHVTPATNCEFRPFVHYNPGDSVGLNIDDTCGPELMGAVQRIDGFDVSVGLDGVGAVSELQTLQDS